MTLATRCLLHCALALALAAPMVEAASFVYEGRLDDLGQPANGRYDLKLSAYGDAALGATLAAPITFEGVEVKDGRFRLDVDLPLVNADQVWLDVAVRGSGEPSFSVIPGRSKAIAAPLIGACWSTTGDSGVNPATNFIGTTDAQPFVARTGNAQSLRIEPSSILAGSPALPITTNTILGSHGNFARSSVRGAAIAGGGVPLGTSDPQFGSGSPNNVTDHYGTIGGGFGNRSGDDSGTTGDRPFATVGGGRWNTAAGHASTVTGGESNTASGFRSTVAGGSDNCAGGAYSWAGGRRAKVRPGSESTTTGFGCFGLEPTGISGDEGTFAWADAEGSHLISTGPNQFLVRASGGVWFGTNSLPNIPTGRFINTSSGAHLTTGGTWTNASSRAFKTAFEPINAGDVLARLLALPLTRWQYRKSPAEGVHLGPVAEEFHAAFGLGADGQSISTVDANGVALAAIQGLNAKLEAENAALRAGQERLAADLAELRALVRANAVER